MLRILYIALFLAAAALLIFMVLPRHQAKLQLLQHAGATIKPPASEPVWNAPDSNQILQEAEASLILYGRALISRTSEFFGPAGKLAHSANGMNCQNCHLDAGTRPWGNNYAAVQSTYPKFRERRGAVESIPQRINDCFNRSLNGASLDSNGYEMKAIMAYMRWLGKNVPKGKKPAGAGILSLPPLDRAADPEKGKLVYLSTCQRCHGPEGQGTLNPGKETYKYPPLWGPHSYNTAAGLYRISRFAGYVKANMPFETTYLKPLLTDAEAWDVAAFVNSQPRPTKNYNKDWPNIASKPFDHPFGPYADGFSEHQHKYGPFKPILKAKDSLSAKKNS